MRIAFVTPVVYPFVKGGVEKRIHEVGRRLAAGGHDVTIYSRNWWDGPERTEHYGMKLRAVSPARELYAQGDRRSIPGALSFAVRSARAVATADCDYDVVVTPVAPYFHVLSLRLATLPTEGRLVVTWHEVWDEYWDRYLDRFGAIGRMIERLTAAVPHVPFTVSEMMAEKLQSIAPTRDDVEVIPNGIDIESVRSTRPAEDGYDVLFAGRLIEDKNVHDLLEAFDRIADEWDVTLGIIGEGPQEDALSEKASELSNADRVTFLGFLEEYDDVIAHMRAASLFVSPSVREGFGITLLEAMAAGCTVVTVDHPHSAGGEIVDDAGFVTSLSTQSLVETMDRALAGDRPPTDPVTRARQYDWDRIAKRELAFYRRLCDA